MTKEDYKQLINDLMDQKQHAMSEYDKKMNLVRKEYAVSNRKHNTGDVITHDGQSIIVDKITWSCGLFQNKDPFCIYFGRLLKKDGTLRKDGKTGYISDEEA